jgi:hypothetical protein
MRGQLILVPELFSILEKPTSYTRTLAIGESFTTLQTVSSRTNSQYLKGEDEGAERSKAGKISTRYSGTGQSRNITCNHLRAVYFTIVYSTNNCLEKRNMYCQYQAGLYLRFSLVKSFKRHGVPHRESFLPF